MNKTTEALKRLLSYVEQTAQFIPHDFDDEGIVVAALLREALAEPVKRPQNCGTGYCSCIECPYEPVKQEPVELIGVKEAIEEGGGFWRSCSGCYESNEGAPPNGATFSTVFQCYLGCGCDECGGIGAIWDNTDYEEMARFMSTQDAAPVQPVKQEPVAEVKVRPLRGDESTPKVYIEWKTKPTQGLLYAAPVEAKAIRKENK